MFTCSRSRTLVSVVAAASLAACRPTPALESPAPVSLTEGYCWWSVFRSPLPLDTVTARFASAFAAAGLEAVSVGRSADTSWVTSAATALERPGGRGLYSARVVAYRYGDSTHFRHYVSLGSSGERDPAARDSAPPSAAARRIAFCEELGRRSAVHGVAPGEPDGEERLAVWRRRP